MRNPIFPAALSLLLAVSPLAAHAQSSESASEATTDVGAVDPAFARAYDVAMSRIGQTLSHDETVQINLLAYASAAAGLCEKLELDEAAIYGALAEISHAHIHGLSTDVAHRRKDFSLIAFGILTGLILEAAVHDEAEFCTEAVEYSNEMGIDAFVVPVHVNVEAQ